MKAFAVLDGGGVKGAALAGALAAAEDKKIKFVGFGGTSAGSIVALLASVGYTGTEIFDRLKTDIHPLKLLDDDGTLYRNAMSAIAEGMELVKTRKVGCCGRKAIGFIRNNRELFRKLGTEYGLYSGETLTKVLLGLVVEKIPQIQGIDDPTFEQLEKFGGRQLKIVASDTHARRAIVYHKGPDSPSQSVLQAVRASASYPFFFTPIKTSGGKRLVDGGLSSNLPVFLFDKEHEKTQLPIIAFDLVSVGRTNKPGVLSFIEEIADTAFEASDELISMLLPGLKHIRVKVPPNIHTLQFDLKDAEIDAMFQAGRSDASEALNTWDLLSIATKAGEEIQKELKAYYGPEALFAPALRSLKLEIEKETNATEVRTHIMVPTGRPNGSRIVVYHFGFRPDDTDNTLELAEFGGCSGRSNSEHAPVVADLVDARTRFASAWEMTDNQQRRVAKDRQAMMSVPVFAREQRDSESEKVVPIRAILSIDSSSSLEESGWIEKTGNSTPSVTKRVTELAIEWAAVVSKLLS